MKTNKKSLKAIVLSLGLAVMTLAANNLNAQDRGLFGCGASESELANRNAGTSFTVNTQDFGQDAPLGSGIAILIGAGLGYVALKKKED